MGGSLSAAPNALKKGLYSFGSEPSPYLRLFYPLFNGENLDWIIGFYQHDATDAMYSDYF